MQVKSNIKRFSLLGIYLIQLCLMSGLYSQDSSYQDSVVFNYKGAPQTWVVPKGVTQVHVDAYGAQGGSELGGKGGRVQADLKVVPGSSVIVTVGSQPESNKGGYNGGGKGCGTGTGGGGASDVRIGGSVLDSRVLVAGGGGGMGYNFNGMAGLGGGLMGGDGAFDTLSYHTAKGGTQSEGGEGAKVYYSPAGKVGKGGDGISSRGTCINDGMGGGGGGYYGGGGSGAGGGGGGSSYTHKDSSNVTHEQGVNLGNGKVIVYWERPKK